MTWGKEGFNDFFKFETCTLLHAFFNALIVCCREIDRNFDQGRIIILKMFSLGQLSTDKLNKRKKY